MIITESPINHEPNENQGNDTLIDQWDVAYLMNS